MTPEQRYTLDLDGFLHLRAVLSPAELVEARAAAGRYTSLVAAGQQTDSDFATEPSDVLGNGFAWDPSLAALAVHPAVLPIISELCGHQPQLRRGSLLWDHPTHPAAGYSGGKPMHSGREDYPENHGGVRFPHRWFIAEGDELRCSVSTRAPRGPALSPL
jgi:hypothetical protein